MSDMPAWFAWLVLACGISIFVASLLYAREVLRYRKVVRGFEWPSPDRVSIAANLIRDMDQSQLEDLASRAGIQMGGGKSA
jgi:hypothetical protein